MSNFIYNSYCVEHPGVVRIYPAEEERLAAAATPQKSSQSHWLLLAIVMVAVAAAVHEITESWADVHVLAAWIVLWAMAFAGAALFSSPARRSLCMVRTGYRSWVDSHQQAVSDERVWNAALQDARLMADLARAMDRQSR